MFKGSLVALITPFQDGAVDETAFQEHVAWQIGQGTHGLVPIGTTGECPALEEEEQERLEALLLEGLDSGEGIEVTPEFWKELRAELVERRRKAKQA